MPQISPLARFARPFLYGAIGVAAIFFSAYRVFDLYEFQTYDWRCQLRGARPTSDRIVQIDIWDDTVKALGAWPFDRVYHANLIRALSQAGARAIVFDVLFSEPRDHDAMVAKAAKDAGNVYFPIALSEPKSVRGKMSSPAVESALLPSYADAARGLGYVNAKADGDGKIRRIPPQVWVKGRAYKHLSFRLAEDLLFELGNKLNVPLDEEGYFIINFAGRWEKTFKHYSYVDVIRSSLLASMGEKPLVDPVLLKGKICIVGLTTTGSHDTGPVPIQAVYPKVGIYANILNSLIQKDFIRRVSRWINLLPLLLVSLGILLITRHFKPLKAIFFTLTTIALFVLAVVGLFILCGFWLDLFFPLLFFTAVYAVTALSRSLVELRKRELIENELKIASEIQKSFLPQTLPDEKGLSIAVHMKPAKAVGGDLYAFTRLVEGGVGYAFTKPSEGKVGVLVGDVSGKGAPAALFMAKVVSEFKFWARDKMDPSEVLSALNKSICSESTGGLFVTLSYVIFDLKNKKLLLADAGHLPLVVVSSGSMEAELVSGGEGMPVGVSEEATFTNRERSIKTGDSFVLYSDGISEARNSKKEEYGIEILQKELIRARDLDAEKMLGQIVSGVNRFIGKAEQHDDMTLIVVRVT